MPPFKVNSASPPHPRLTSRLCFPSSHSGCFMLPCGMRYLPRRLKQPFRSDVNVRGTRFPLRPARFAVYASSILFHDSLTVTGVVRVRVSPSVPQRPVYLSLFMSAIDATLATGGWQALSRRGLSPRKTHQASLGALTPLLSRHCTP